MDKTTLFVMAVLFETQVQQEALRIKTSVFLNINFGEVAELAAAWASSRVCNLSQAKEFANELLLQNFQAIRSGSR
jgi:hypothetical protein